MSAARLSAIPAVAYALPVIALAAVFIIGASVKILRESERAVVFKLGRFQRVKGPGVVLLIPFIQEMVSETSR
jgi:regulator of protease activity HflC (stomatin/prohibitin superfamily)